ncbi:MAG: DUF1566 domain-containing protein [Deltaproteobacteria bacterium]|nr:DUF1566 domain-containing protein [Deltaproteobacteria bacterium]
MVQKDRFWLLLCVFILGAFIFVYPAFAEVKVFEQEVEESVSRGQSQEQVEAFALQKAKRLAVEEAGTYISSLTVVRNYQLQSDEVTALASGVVQAKIVGIPAVRVENGVVHVKVKARIDVDTSILDRQVQEIMKEKGTLKKLEKERKKNKELEEKLANLKSSEVKRLEELNTQALALERERDRQRLFREEQAIKARGELSNAEADRFKKEREMLDRINRTLAEQEKAKRDEATALAAEQDRIKRAQLENEQRWNDLSRKAKLSQDSWVAIDDSLSLKQAMVEVNDLKREIANLKGRLDYQYEENIKNLKAAYVQQYALMTKKLPPEPAPKDVFEKMIDYNARILAYEQQVKKVEKENGETLEILKKKENLKTAQVKVDYMGQQLRVLTPFVQRLQDLQNRKFTLPEGGTVMVDLGEPDADNNRFPIILKYNGKSWSKWWNYRNVNRARDFYRTRTYLKAEGLFQIEEAEEIHPRLTMARVTHMGMKETQEFSLEKPRIFVEIDQLRKFKKEEATAKVSHEKAAIAHAHIKIESDGRFIAYNDGTVLDTRTNLMWAAKDNGGNISWVDAKRYCENYQGGGYTDWRMPTKDELDTLYDEDTNYTILFFYGIHMPRFIRLTMCGVWASETRGYKAYYILFGCLGDKRGWRFQGEGSGIRALPVRSNK